MAQLDLFAKTFIDDTTALHNWVQGDENAVVNVAGGPLDSPRKLIKQWNAAANLASDGVLAQAVAAKNAAQQAAADAAGTLTGAVKKTEIDLADWIASVRNAVYRVATVAALRALTAPSKATSVIVEGYYAAHDGGGGVWAWDADSTAADNGTTVARPAANPASGRWRLVHSGTVTLAQAGLKADWNGTTGTDNRARLAAALADSSISKLQGNGGAYYFGVIAGNTSLFTVTRDLVIDWGGAQIIVSGQNDAAYTSTAFITFKDCRMNMGGHVFDDIAFAIIGGPSRGVQPVVLIADVAKTKGHNIGPMLVKRGQSLLTCASNAPLTARSQDITFRGACRGDIVYYGLNCANNGDRVKGAYSVGQVDRSIFIYGVDGVDIDLSADSPIGSSANLFISASGSGFPATQNVKIRAKFDVLNGPIVLADQPSSGGSGVYSNIDLTVSVKSYGTNLPSTVPAVRIGCFDSSSNYLLTEQTVSMKDIRIDFRPDPAVVNMDDAFKIYTPSPNYGRFSINQESQYSLYSLFPKNASGVFMGPAVIEAAGRYFTAVWGDLTNANSVAKIPVAYLSNRRKNMSVGVRLRVRAANGVGISVPYTISDYFILGTLAGDGSLTLETPSQISTYNANGTPCTFTISTTGPGDFLTVSASLYTNASGLLVVSAEMF